MTLVLLGITLWKTLRKEGLYVSYLIWYNSSDVDSLNREKQCVVGTKGPRRQNNDARDCTCSAVGLVHLLLGAGPAWVRTGVHSAKPVL